MFPVSHQPTSISAHAFPTPSPSPPWDRGLNQHPFIAVTPPPIPPSAAGTTTLLTPSTSPANMAQLVHNSPQMVILPASSNPGVKDSRWLTLEVCREFQRSKCSRTDTECKFAHPPPHVEIQNGRVVACFDSIKGKCQRKDPPCKYLHPPQHLREQLLQNGRNNLILKNLHIQAYQTQYTYQPMAGGKTVTMSAVMPGQYSYLAHPSSSQAPPQAVLRPPTMTPAVAAAVAAVAPSPYDAATHYPGLQAMSTVPAQAPTAAYSSYLPSFASVPMPGSADPTSVMSQMMPANMIAAKSMRADKFETSADNGETMTSHASLMESFTSYPTYITQVCREFQRGTCSRPASECRYAHPAEHIVVDATDNHVTVCMDFVKSKCTRDQCKYFHPPSHLQALVRAAHARNQAAVSNNITNSCSTLTPSAAAMSHPMVIAKKRPRDPTDDLLLQSTVPGMMPAYKRIAIGDISKGGYPMYQTNHLMSPLQHPSLMHLQQQPSYIPLSYTYVYPHEATHAAAPTAYSPHHLTAFNPATMFSMSPSMATTSAASSNLISSIMASTSMAGTTTSSSSGDPGLVPASGLSLYMMPKNSHSSSNISSSNITTSAHGATHVPSIPNNAYHVEYFGSNKQLRDTLPVCQEFKSGLCDSPYCQLVHLSEDYVEEINNQVTVCRDFATRQTCRRTRCKYYHIPVDLPPS